MKIFFLSLLVVSCATSSDLLRLQDRTLLIDEKSASLIYPTFETVCKKRTFFKRCKRIRKIVKYKLDDPETRNKLISSGFRCQSTLRFKY